MSFEEWFLSKAIDFSEIVGESIRSELDALPEKSLSYEEYEFIAKISTSSAIHLLRLYYEWLSELLPELQP